MMGGRSLGDTSRRSLSQRVWYITTRLYFRRRDVSFPQALVDIPAEDFFSRVHAHMNVDPETAVLGWKESVEPKKSPYHRLSSPEDLNEAIKGLMALQNSSRRKRPVIMEVVNLEVQSDGKAVKQAEKDSESAVTSPELAKVLAKLTCALHPGKNRWCYATGPKSKHPGTHVAVGIDVATLWARKIHDKEADEDCVEAPNILNLDGLAEGGRAREERSTRGRGQAPALPPIHVHVGGSDPAPLRQVDTNLPNPPALKRRRDLFDNDSDSDDSDDDGLTVMAVLEELH
ncbi:hypothetical protein B0H19DRAFT_1194217 [Mycena capillaripes]|nr:hypothetical protein B0H19DRAFT_1194217 [Mycena capillaripes]